MGGGGGRRRGGADLRGPLDQESHAVDARLEEATRDVARRNARPL